MRPQIHKGFMHTESSETHVRFGSVRSPIQSEGIERGHRRMADVAVSGSVDPQQFGYARLGLLKNILPIANLF